MFFLTMYLLSFFCEKNLRNSINQNNKLINNESNYYYHKSNVIQFFFDERQYEDDFSTYCFCQFFFFYLFRQYIKIYSMSMDDFLRQLAKFVYVGYSLFCFLYIYIYDFLSRRTNTIK